MQIKPKDQLYIYTCYIDFELGVPIVSPIRDEGRPSFAVFETYNGDYKWSDFGASDGSDDVIEFVKKYQEYHNGHGTYKTACKEIRRILDGERVQKKLPKHKKNKTLDLKVRDLLGTELSFWSKRGIGLDILARDLTLALDSLKVKGFEVAKSTLTEPKFVYLYKTWDNVVIPDCYKIYAPFSEKKWITHNTHKANFETLPQKKYDRLVVLSSRKDKEVFDILGFKFDTTNPISEGNFRGLLKDSNIMGYKEKYALFDFDSSNDSKKGVERTKQIEEESGGEIKGIYLEEGLRKFLINDGVKDIDEAYIKYGRTKTIDLIKRIWKDQGLSI